MTVSDIKNTFLRRCVLMLTLPVVLVVHEPRALAWPFAALGDSVMVGARAAWGYFCDDWLNGDAELLLRRGFALMWDRDYHADRDAAMARAKKIGSGQ